MRRIDLTRCLGMALVFWGVLAAAGCQQVPMNHGSPANKSANDSSPAQANLTAAQQADMQIAMGRVSENQGDLTGAMNIYREALKRNQNSAEAHARMAVVHDKQGEFRESAELYRKALQLSPGNPDIFCDMGYSLYLQRRWAEAEMNLRQAIAWNANFARGPQQSGHAARPRHPRGGCPQRVSEGGKRRGVGPCQCRVRLDHGKPLGRGA